MFMPGFNIFYLAKIFRPDHVYGVSRMPFIVSFICLSMSVATIYRAVIDVRDNLEPRVNEKTPLYTLSWLR